MARTAVVILCLVVAVAAPFAEAITCGQVATSLAPCIGFLTKGGAVPPACCGSLSGLHNAAKSTPDLQTVCSCLKGILQSNSGINVNNANIIPGKCGLNIPYKISPNIDCSTVH